MNVTMAALARNAAERFGEGIAARSLRDGQWVDLTYAGLWQQVRDVALGLVALGVEVGDRVSILANTRVEFTVVDLAASTTGAIVVPVYPSNSADECEWVVGDSGAKVIICEDAGQVAKIDEVRAGLPDLEHVIVIDGEAPGALSIAEVVARGAGVGGRATGRAGGSGRPGRRLPDHLHVRDHRAAKRGRPHQ